MTRLSFWPLVALVSALGLIAAARAADPQPTIRTAQARKAEPQKPSDEALERARREVRMLDDLYKTSIVMITEAYVTEKSDLPAGSAFQKLFQTMREKGWHDVRLIDATGEPYDEDNLPKDDFEKAAIKALKAGKPSDEKIITKNGKNYLRVATAIPVVMEKCTLCHENYKKAPKGQAIGALGYELEIR